MDKCLMISALALALVLTGCRSDTQTEWGLFQEPTEPGVLPTVSGGDELALVWRSTLGLGAVDGFAILRPAYGGEGVLACSRDGLVALFDPDTGARKWQVALNEPIFSGVAVADGLVVVTQQDGVTVALDEHDGTVRWRAAIDRQISSVPTVGHGRVVVRTADGLVVALRADNGDRQWEFKRSVPELSLHGDPSPVITGDVVLIGLSNGRLLANNVLTGREYWETELAFSQGRNELARLADVDSAPLVAANRVFTASYQGNIVALQLEDAAVQWKTRLSTRLDLALLDERLFVIDSLGGLFALDSTTGEILWQQEGFRGHGVSRPLAQRERVLIGDASGMIYALDAASGVLMDALNVSSNPILSIIPTGERFVALSSRGELIAFSLSATPAS